MKVLELFAGTRSIGKAFEAAGHEVYSIEWEKDFEGIDWYMDIGKITARDILERFGRPSVIWASPDCATYSIAAISHHRTKEESGNLAPKSDYAGFCDSVNRNMLRLIEDLQPEYFFIENPVGGLRKMDFMQGIPCHSITYCRYGDDRQKPTDIFTNHPSPGFLTPCKRGGGCHVSAPRGSRTGTQGRKKVDRSRIPEDLCRHIVEICE